MRILVADDDPTSRLIVQTALEILGHECFTASDGVQAWEMFLSHHPEVVISDWSMPGLTGLELCRNIRAHEGTYAYFIMVTSNRTREQILEGMHVGADDYLIKPLDADDLQLRLIAAARVTELHQQLDFQRRELEGLNRGLTAISLLDPLTNLGNRRALQADLEMLEARVVRYGHQSCMALIDIDFFKGYNDSYGHLAGDEVITAVANQLKQQARAGDAVYRYGGDEFICLFPQQSLETGAIAVQRMRLGVENLAIAHIGSPLGLLTISAGLALLSADQGKSATDFVREADAALYRAKGLGRNRIESVVTPVDSLP
jgi:two-component system chemotaxis response regulator CheY